MEKPKYDIDERTEEQKRKDEMTPADEKEECWTLATLERYHFRDDNGHPLENCIEYVKILGMAQKYFTLDTATGGEIERLFSYIRGLETKLENESHRADTFQRAMIKSAEKYRRASEMLKTAAFQVGAWYEKQEKDDVEIASILRCMKREIENTTAVDGEC